MYVYQDLQQVGESNIARMDFVKSVINDHQSSELYKEAEVAELYDKHRNKTINEYQKLLYTMAGNAVPDNYSANWKMGSNIFHRFVIQEKQHLLGNGVTWANSETAERLGKDFDSKLQKLAHYAIVGGVGFGFFNLDHLEVFKVTEFAPLYDEENGALMAGVRFWQVSKDKPLHATLYELDGYADYIWVKSEGRVLAEKRPYVLKTLTTEADGTVIYDGENYPTFPIVPMWGNMYRQSELVGLREQIDCYDLIKSGFANDLDDASQIYWTIQNAGGMDDLDLAKFLERMKTVKAAIVDDVGARAEAHTLDVPYASRETLLARLERDMYRDAMALDMEKIQAGAVTATQIKAAYKALNDKCDDLEYNVLDFLQGILFLAGIEDENPTFTRSINLNVNEEVQTIVASAPYLESEYVTRKILTLLGDGDQADEIIERIKKKQQEAQQTQLLQQKLQQLQKQQKEEGENGDRQNVNGEGDEQGERGSEGVG